RGTTPGHRSRDGENLGTPRASGRTAVRAARPRSALSHYLCPEPERRGRKDDTDSEPGCHAGREETSSADDRLRSPAVPVGDVPAADAAQGAARRPAHPPAFSAGE